MSLITVSIVACCDEQSMAVSYFTVCEMLPVGCQSSLLVVEQIFIIFHRNFVSDASFFTIFIILK